MMDDTSALPSSEAKVEREKSENGSTVENKEPLQSGGTNDNDNENGNGNVNVNDADSFERLKRAVSSSRLLDSVRLSSDGRTLELWSGENGTATGTIDATAVHTVPGTDRTYSLASLYLLCRHPSSVVQLKQASRDHGVKDSVKVTHRTAVLAYFGLGTATATATGGGADGPKDDTLDVERDSNSNSNRDRVPLSRTSASTADASSLSPTDAGRETHTQPSSTSLDPSASGSGSTSADKATSHRPSSSRSSSSNHSKVGSSSSHSHSHKDKDKDKHKDRSHGSSSSSRHHRKDRDRDEHRGRDRERDRDRKERSGGSSSKLHHKGSSSSSTTPSSSSSSQPITNEQVLQNLDLLHGKREGERKRKPTDVPTMDTTTLVATAENGAASSTTDTPSNVGVAGGTADTHVASTSNTNIVATNTTTNTTTNTNTVATSDSLTKPKDSQHAQAHPDDVDASNAYNQSKELVTKALSAEGFVFSEEAVAADREATELVTSAETPVGDSSSILRFASRDFSKVLGLYMEIRRSEDHAQQPSSRLYKKKKLNPPGPGHHEVSGTRRSSSHGHGHGHTSNGGGNAYSSRSKEKKKKVTGPPLIIVPNAMTAPVGLSNAVDFFARSRYVARSGLPRTKNGTVTFSRNVSARLGGASLEYEIRDSPLRLKHPEDWDRIVAVVALGEAWQFKGWQLGWNKPVDIFARCFGFYIGMEGAPLPKGLQGWNVVRATLNRDKRGLDSVAHASFWNSLDEWMYLHKRHYLPLSQDH